MAKSTRPTIRIHNIETDEIIDREMNDAEFAQYQTDQAAQAIAKAEAEAKEQEIRENEIKKEIIKSKFAELGITEDDLRILGL